MNLEMDKHLTVRKKLIEVALPLVAINTASAREKSIRHGHPSTLHLWWARRPLAAARAVIFAQMVDDPSGHPERFPTEEAQEAERQRLFRLIEELVLWENINNQRVLAQAREEIWKSWRVTCAENRGHPRAKELFDPEKLPAFHDPFAGGGALPLEAQRLGLESYASDLNPVAVLINKAMIEIPPKFAGRPPINPASRKDNGLIEREWQGARGLGEDVRYYGQWMRDEAEKRIGHLYPKIEITTEMAKERPDLRPSVGKKLNVIAWLWARTVKSPNPAFAHVDVPLASTFMLSTKPGKEAYFEPVVEADGYRFVVKVGKPQDAEKANNGMKLARGANFQCVMSGTPMASDYIKAEGLAGRMGTRLMAIVADGERGRVYLSPPPEIEVAAQSVKPTWVPEGSFVEDARAFTPCIYGLKEWRHLFTPRQLVALATFSDLIQEVRERVKWDALAAGVPDDGLSLNDGGCGATGYGDAVTVYLSLALSRLTDICNALCRWEVTKTQVRNLFGRQAIPMVWDFAENNVFGEAAGDYIVSLSNMVKALDQMPASRAGMAHQADAQSQMISKDKLVSTDPPYYDNVPYADLSDFFYVWLRRSLRLVYPELFATLAVPKAEELVATSYRHGGREKAEAFFLKGMTQAMHRLAEEAHPAFPITIYYAFKQAESESAGTASTGWETFLDAVIHAGFAIAGTWPMRTELANRMRGSESNALASSIVLVCHPRQADARTATRREFVNTLKEELPEAVKHLQRGNIAPVDLAQSAIGPGMAVYTRYAKVLDAEGRALTVRDALALINQTLDEAMAEQEGDFDADSRWAVAWFEQTGFDEGEYGVAETLSKAKNTTVSGMVHAGILASKGGKVRLLRPHELPEDWDPEIGNRMTAWESVHHLVRALEAAGENAAGALVAKLGSKAEMARELAYRLYTVCERKKRAQEALSYNGLVQSWPEITRLAHDGARTLDTQTELFNEE
jgi:putative DNA methylase